MALISKKYLEELVFFADIPSQAGSYCILDVVTTAVPPKAVYMLRKTRTLASHAYASLTRSGVRQLPVESASHALHFFLAN
jgi:hypothetical protein